MGGGLMLNDSYALLSNATFFRNTAVSGAAAYEAGSQLYVTDSTFAYNLFEADNGLFHIEMGSDAKTHSGLYLLNNLFIQNSAGDLFVGGTGITTEDVNVKHIKQTDASSLTVLTDESGNVVARKVNSTWVAEYGYNVTTSVDETETSFESEIYGDVSFLTDKTKNQIVEVTYGGNTYTYDADENKWFSKTDPTAENRNIKTDQTTWYVTISNDLNTNTLQITPNGGATDVVNKVTKPIDTDTVSINYVNVTKNGDFHSYFNVLDREFATTGNLIAKQVIRDDYAGYSY